MRLRVIAIIVLISGILGSIAGVTATQVFDNGSDGSSAAVAPAPTTSAGNDDDSGQQTSLSTDCLTAADVFEQVRPSVVEITSAISNGFGPQGQGTGTGIVIDTDGHILTNNHVIAGAQTIEVRFADGSTDTASVVGRDPANDLAVIQVSPSDDLVPASLGDSDALRVGDPVLAIGNPFNLEATLTQGIVSAIDRTYTPGAGTRPIREMIQTDAAVNPGNSGGPLLNCRGEVIGVNSLLENPSGDSVNVGVAFAVAVNTAKRSLPDMLSGETVNHPWLGIAGMDVTPALAEELGLDSESGVYVTLVSQGSPADDLGLQGAFASQNQASSSADVPPGGDVIVSVDGEPVTSLEELATYLDKEKRPGDQVDLGVLRDGESLALTATLADWPA